MISRRLLRVKVFQNLFAYFKGDEQSLQQAEKKLFFSIQKSHELYHYLLLLIIDVNDYARGRIELAQKKLKPSAEDLRPNRRFIDNKLIHLLRDNIALQKFLNEKKLSWVNYPEIIKNIYLQLKESDFYKTYMEKENSGFKEDKQLVNKLVTHIFLTSDELVQNLEEQSIFWNDDIDFVAGMLLKTLKSFKVEKGEENELMKLFKNEEDVEFTKNLFRKSILHYQEYEKLIASFVENWDIERIAFSDVLLMVMAVTEVVEFESIPVKVTLDEYIEVAKYYSTQKSSVFINGILDKAMSKLKEEGKVKKVGRGLMGEL